MAILAGSAPVPDPGPAPSEPAIILTPLPEAAGMSSRELYDLEDAPPGPSAPAPAADPTPAPAAPESPSKAPIAMVPNADGLLDLTHLGETGEDDPIPNPFRLRYHPAAEVREVRLEIGSVLVGGRAGDASAIVNGQVVSPGDSLEGLKVASIDGDALELVRDGVRVRLPVGDRAFTLRLPR
jgi:hypothetical protein